MESAGEGGAVSAVYFSLSLSLSLSLCVCVCVCVFMHTAQQQITLRSPNLTLSILSPTVGSELVSEYCLTCPSMRYILETSLSIQSLALLLTVKHNNQEEKRATQKKPK